MVMADFALYLDDSGHPKDKPFVAVAGFIASESQWLEFDPKWKAALKKYGLGDAFHMTDFSAKGGKLSALKKEQILAALRKIIRDHTITAFASGVDIEAYRRVNADYTLEECLGAPYALVVREITRQLHAWQKIHCQPDDQFLIFVEEGTLHFGDLEQIAKRDKLPNPIKVPKKNSAVQPAEILGWEYFNYLRTKKISKNLWGLLRSRVATGTVFWESDLVETCKRASVIPRNSMTSKSTIAFHSNPKRKRRRTIN
jgi:hypothetical protein